MKNATKWTAIGVALGVLLCGQPAVGQVPGASPATLGTAQNYMVLARGYAAIGLNPAGLGMAGAEGFTLALFPTQVSQSMEPLGISAFLDYEGEVIPASVKEDWLQQITDAGGQTGTGTVEFTPIALSIDRLGIQFSTLASASTNLNPDVAELLFFGNSGRTGTPGDFDLSGAQLTGYAVSTIAISLGFPLSRRWVPGVEQGFAIGGTVKHSWGHALVHAENREGILGADPVVGRIEFPMIYSSRDSDYWSGGSGLGLDVGVSWKRDSWALAGVVQNLVNGFGWELREMSYRRGRIYVDRDSRQAIYEEWSGEFASEMMKDRVKDLTFNPTLSAGAAYSGFEDVTITAEIRQRTGDGLETGPKSHFGMGLQYFATPTVPIYAGAAVITDGFQAGGGFGLTLGRVQVGASALFRQGDVANSLLGMVGISVLGRRDGR